MYVYMYGVVFFAIVSDSEKYIYWSENVCIRLRSVYPSTKYISSFRPSDLSSSNLVSSALS